MRELILEKLHEIEEKEQVRILMAVESGSRAWGFASPDSDYDVRFIYVRPREDYLRLDRVRDVIELPINDLLDINGWDLKKALTLLHKSNPTLFEWATSPIIYMETEFADTFRKLINDYFLEKRGLYHYLSMAERNYKEYLKGELVKAKKYFYVLRPVLACRWILEKGAPPPMLFSELAKAQLPKELEGEIESLLELKMNAPEVKEIQRIDKINDYLDASIREIKRELVSMVGEEEGSWDALNELFLKETGNYFVTSLNDREINR